MKHSEHGAQKAGRGFTLIEVMVSLLVGTLIAGGVMGVISASLRYEQHLKEKTSRQPVLEAAAQEILADPQKTGHHVLKMDGLPGVPVVEISLTPVVLPQNRATAQPSDLTRVQLLYQGEMLEFSVLVPRPKLK